VRTLIVHHSPLGLLSPAPLPVLTRVGPGSGCRSRMPIVLPRPDGRLDLDGAGGDSGVQVNGTALMVTDGLRGGLDQPMGKFGQRPGGGKLLPHHR